MNPKLDKHQQKAVNQLHFISSERIERIAGDKRKQEQDAYLEEFAREIEKIRN